MKRYLFRFFIFFLTIAIFFGIFRAGAFICCVARETKSEYDLPILMYHHILKDTKKHGEFIISPDELEEDLKYLKKEGYTAVLPRDIMNYQKTGAPLPEKPIMLTFDDGHLSYLEYVVPLLEKYEMCALVSVVGAYTNDYTEHPDRAVAYAYLDWNDITALSKSTHTEIGNHTYDLHKVANGRQGCARKKGETAEQHKKIFCADLLKMRKLIHDYTGTDADCFTYPFGFMCPETEEEIKNAGFKMSLSCTEGINKISRDSSLFKLKRFNRPHGRSAQEILTKK